MYTIKKNSIYQYEIKKSKFITLLYKINTINEIEKIFNEIKNRYSDATHCCFGYKINGIQKFSDDGEPGGTAGLPIMEVINKKNLDYILCVVVRYFGGIKLGAGGLVRAYSKAVRDAIDSNEIIELTKGYLIKVTAAYQEQKQFDYLFSKNIINKEFNENIVYQIKIEKENVDKLNNYKYVILDEIMMEKESN